MFYIWTTPANLKIQLKPSMGEIRNYLVANPIQYILWVKCESRSNEYHNARARSPWRKRKLEERRRTTPSVIIANGGNSIGESLLHRLLFNRNTFHPPLPGYLCFKTTGMGSSTTKILRSAVSRFLNLCNEGKKKNISKNRSRVIHFQREKFMLIH